MDRIESTPTESNVFRKYEALCIRPLRGRTKQPDYFLQT